MEATPKYAPCGIPAIKRAASIMEALGASAVRVLPAMKTSISASRILRNGRERATSTVSGAPTHTPRA